MTLPMLFCIAEDAKPFIHRILDEDHLYLAQSRSLPSDKSGLKRKLKDDKDLDTEFIGASKEECQKWVLEKGGPVNFIAESILAIADERTSRDGTILVSWYSYDLEPVEFEPYGILPGKGNTWYDFRIDPKAFTTVVAALEETEPDVIYPTYFGRKEELTDENGVFNVIEAVRAIVGKKYSAFECLYLRKNRDTGIWERL